MMAGFKIPAFAGMTGFLTGFRLGGRNDERIKGRNDERGRSRNDERNFLA